jgi:hypothetical protein
MAGQEQTYLENVFAACQGMAVFQASITMEVFDAVRCKQAMYQCLQSLAVLSHLWRDGLAPGAEAFCPFPLRPKSHMLHHLCEDKLQLWGSPCNSWSYRDEDYIGVVKVIAAKSCHPKTLEKRVIEKLMIASSLGLNL